MDDGDDAPSGRRDGTGPTDDGANPSDERPAATLREDHLALALGSAWSDDRCWELLTKLTELPHRMGGSPGERRAADFVGEAFTDAGLADVQQAEFSMRYWERATTELAVLGTMGEDEASESGRSFEAIALPYAPAGDVQGPLVDVGYGTPAELEDVDVQGKIAVASTTTPPGQRFVHRMEKFGHAVAAGADAFVFANHITGQLPPTGALKFDAEAAMPGVGVSAETHDWLREYADRGARARIRVDASTEPGSSQNVHGTLGPDTDEEVLVVAHYDAHDTSEGALDNGCGIAIVAGASAILAELEADLECRVRVAGVGCEEIGLLGAEALADELDLESIRAVINVDGAGRFRNLRAYSHGSSTIEAMAEEVTDAVGQPVSHEPDPHPFSDHWPFLRGGVPSLQLHSEPPEGAERGRGWGHTAADTRDKVDPRNLREHAMLTALLVREATRRQFPRRDERELREQLQSQSYEPGMRAADIWPRPWDNQSDT